MDNGQDSTLLALHRIEDLLRDILSLMQLSQKSAIAESKKRLLDGSKIRREVYGLCNGKNTVNEIAKKIGKKQPQVSVALSELEEAKLVKPIKKGNKVYYAKTFGG